MLVVAGCHAPKLFEFPKEAFDRTSFFVNFRVDYTWFARAFTRGDYRVCFGTMHSIYGHLPVIAFICKNMFCLKPFKQSLGLGNIITVATRDDKA